MESFFPSLCGVLQRALLETTGLYLKLVTPSALWKNWTLKRRKTYNPNVVSQFCLSSPFGRQHGRLSLPDCSCRNSREVSCCENQITTTVGDLQSSVAIEEQLKVIPSSVCHWQQVKWTCSFGRSPVLYSPICLIWAAVCLSEFLKIRFFWAAIQLTDRPCGETETNCA